MITEIEKKMSEMFVKYADEKNRSIEDDMIRAVAELSSMKDKNGHHVLPNESVSGFFIAMSMMMKGRMDIIEPGHLASSLEIMAIVGDSSALF
jgi:hypothetical protein